MASLSKARKMGLVSVVALVCVCLADISLVLGDTEVPGQGGFMEHHSTDVSSAGEGASPEDGVTEGEGSSVGGGQAGGILNAVRRLLGLKSGVKDAAGAGNRRLLADEGVALSDSFVEENAGEEDEQEGGEGQVSGGGSGDRRLSVEEEEEEEGGNSTTDDEEGGQSGRRLSGDEEEEKEGGNSTTDDEEGGQSGRRLSGDEEEEEGGNSTTDDEEGGQSGRRLSVEAGDTYDGLRNVVTRALFEATGASTTPKSSPKGGGGDGVAEGVRPSMGMPKPLPVGDPKNSSSVEPSAEEASKRTREAAKLLGEAATLFFQNLGDLLMKSAEIPRDGTAGVVDAIIGGVDEGSEKLKQVASQMGSSISEAMGKWYLELLRRLTRNNPDIVIQAMRVHNMLKNLQGEVTGYGDQAMRRATAAVNKAKREVDDSLG